jgi:hypothetical protein
MSVYLVTGSLEATIVQRAHPGTRQLFGNWLIGQKCVYPNNRMNARDDGSQKKKLTEEYPNGEHMAWRLRYICFNATTMLRRHICRPMIIMIHAEISTFFETYVG